MNKSKIIIIVSLLFFCANFFVSQAQVVEQFKGDRFTQYRMDDWISYATTLNISAVDTDEKYVYFATRGGGILRFDKYREEWQFPYTISSGLRSNDVLDVTYNEWDGFLYARTPFGIDVLRYADNFWQRSDKNSMPSKRQPNLAEVADLRKGKDYRFPPYFRPPNDFFPNFFSERNFTFIPPDQILDNENREYRFTDRMVDEWQRTWLGTNGFGPMMADMRSISLYSYIQGIPNIYLRDVHFEEDATWLGGISKQKGITGITLWNHKDDQWQYFEAQFNSGIAKDDVLAIDGNKNFVAFATLYGVVVLDKKKFRWKTYTPVDGLEGDKVNDVKFVNNIVYIGTENGLNWLNPKNKRVEGISGSIIDNVEINQLTFYSDTLYLATKRGLYGFDIKKNTAKFIASRAAIPDFNLTAINHFDKEIWFANDYGITYINKVKNSWHSFADLSIKPKIYDIAFTKDAVWFASDQGLIKYDRSMNDWRLFTRSDGLMNNKIYHIDVENDKLWLSTESGLTIFKYDAAGRLD